MRMLHRRFVPSSTYRAKCAMCHVKPRAELPIIHYLRTKVLTYTPSLRLVKIGGQALTLYLCAGRSMSWRCVRRGLPGPAAKCVSSSSALPPDLILILANDPDSTRHNHAAATRQLLAAPPIPYLSISKDIISESSTVPKVRVPGHVTMGHKIELEWGEITYFPSVPARRSRHDPPPSSVQGP